MQPESIEVVPSADNGNVPAEAPSEPTTPAAPTVPAEPVVPTEPELYELPDGRKVDAGTVAQEYKNLLSDYTRKSQELAKVKTPELPNNNPVNNQAPQDWVPNSYEEIVQRAEQRALQAIEAKEQARIDHQKSVEDAVSGQLNELKRTDTTLNENALFLHANKYGFRDLKQAHQNMRDMSELAKKVQTTTVQNIAKRIDPVSVTPGASGGARQDPSHFGNALEYLRSLK